MPLYKIEEKQVSQEAQNIIIGDSNWNDGFDIYKVVMYDLQPETDGGGFAWRFRNSGTSISSTDYAYADENMQSSGGFSITGSTTANAFSLFGMSLNNPPANYELYCFNFNDATRYSSVIWNSNFKVTSGDTRARVGGGFLQLFQANNGLDIFTTTTDGFRNLKVAIYGIK